MELELAEVWAPAAVWSSLLSISTRSIRAVIVVIFSAVVTLLMVLVFVCLRNAIKDSVFFKNLAWELVVEAENFGYLNSFCKNFAWEVDKLFAFEVLDIMTRYLET